MAEALELEFPKGTDQAQAQALTEALTRVQGVQKAGIESKRSGIDPASLSAWVTLAAAAVPVISAVVEMIRGKRLKGVKIKVRGKTIEVDEASASDIERLLKP
jgi:hypothetical protein